MEELDTLIQKHYGKKKREPETFTTEELIKMVEDVFEGFNFAPTPVITERMSKEQKESLTMKLSFIPEINVSELGWSDVSTTEEGETVKGPQRRLLEDYLSNVEGETLADKISSLESFYKEGTSVITEGIDNRKEVIQKIMSYLVFYKTLTTIITNFNAASAGFNFESFLSTLLGGRQIPANTGTIADFLTGENIPISLKLYAEKSLSVEGSYTDLVNDLVNPQFTHPDNGMRYVICTKSLSGDGLSQEGKIKFYQFDFTLDNVANIIGVSTEKSQKCIRLPASVRGASENYSLNKELPSVERLPSPEELESIFIANVESGLDGMDPADVKKITQALNWAKNDDIFKPASTDYFGGTEQGVVRGVSKLNLPVVKTTIASLWDQKELRALVAGAGLNFRSFWPVFTAANNAIINQLTKTKLKNARVAKLKDMDQQGEFLSVDESIQLYNSLATPELKKMALQNSWGYLMTYQFHLNRTQSTNPDAPVSSQYQGEIAIGQKAIVEMLMVARDILNEQVFEIFNSLKSLSDNLNSYFAGGLQEARKAGEAIEDAQNIESKTTEISDATME